MTTEVLGCVALYGDVEGHAVLEMVERALGATCPCKSGKVCPVTGMTSGQLAVRMAKPRQSTA